jgi:A-factor biosynthesis hotdog domain
VQPLVKPYQRQLSPTLESAWLRFDRSVSRDLVHRKAVAEVLVTDTVQVAEDEFLLAAQLPRAHSLWSDRRCSYHDPLITIEICRQACLALPQRYYGVPQEWHFISKRIDFRVASLDAYADNESSPPEGILRARYANKLERNGGLIGMSVESELTIDGASAGTVAGELMFFPQADYKEIRSKQRARRPFAAASSQIIARPLDAARVGRLVDRNVVIEHRSPVEGATGECRYGVLVDQRHPCFFDHPQDHIPGPLILEVYRQVAIATATRAGDLSPEAAVITGCQVQLADFAELDAPAECSAVASDESKDGRVQINSALHQFDNRIGEAQVELRFVSLADRPRSLADRPHSLADRPHSLH